MRVLVTGGTGIVGRYVVRELLAAGHVVTNIGRSPGQRTFLDAGSESQFKHVQADLTSAGEVYQALAKSKAEAVVHMGAWANAHMVAPSRTYGDNTIGTFNIFQACADLGIRKVIWGSSCQVYGFERFPPLYIPVDEEHPCRPVNPYGLSKVCSEQAADYFSSVFGVTILSFRILGVRTPEQLGPEIDRLAANLAAGAPLLWSRGDARDCATACRLALERDDVPSGAYNITGGVVLAEPTMKLVERYFGAGTEVREPIAGHASPLSCAKAVNAFGYKPTFLWSEKLSHNE
jgi:nucleoside-diphosphate-sugar epimerase